MISFFTNLLTKCYVYCLGTRFYTSNTLTVKDTIQKFTVKTSHGYTITFKFYKESLSFTKYLFHNRRVVNFTIYAVNATFDSEAPDSIKKYNTLRIFTRDKIFFLSNEKVIMDVLLDVYLDYILHELKGTIITPLLENKVN